MIKYITHLSDIHIKKDTSRHFVHRDVFERTYKKLESQNPKPDRIVITGDLYHDYINLEGEAEVLMGEFLNRLSKINGGTKVILIRGNHDMRKSNLNKKDVISTITTLINNPNVIYYDKSDFYEDDNIVWVVHHHLEGVNPWYDIKHDKQDDKIYIDLYHNPLQGVLGDNGYPLQNNKYKTTDLKGHYSMIGDIHLRQSFNNGRIRYAGSILQNSHGEKDILGHGYINWILEDKDNFSVEEVNIPNDYNFITLEIGKNYNYENISLDSEYITPHSTIKIKWNDLVSNINFSNELLIRDYFKQKFNIEGVSIEKNAIQTNINGVLNESNIDVSDTEIQKEVFNEYMLLNEHNEDTIKKVMLIDDEINSRLTLDDDIKNITWSVLKFGVTNFKSYDNFDIDWEHKDGTYQVAGNNKNGKSTILDSLCYILYGQTLSVFKKIKFRDNSFINNKRSLNFCEGYATISINGSRYTIVRRTERKINKSNKITSCTTKVDFYKGEEIKPENLLTEEQSKDTNKLIINVLGDFNSFIRIANSNADNLNDLLSIDRATFISAISKDAGFDIFSYKEKEFKEYKKEITKDFLNIDISTKEEEIENNKASILIKNDEVKEYDITIKNYNEEKDILQDRKELNIKTLHPIDPLIEKIDTIKLEKEIELDTESIDANKRTIKLLEPLKDEIKDYDTTKLEEKQTELSKFNINITNYNKTISDIELSNSKITNKISNINNNIDTNVNEYKNNILLSKKDIENEILTIKKDFVSSINDFTSNLKDELNTVNIDKTEQNSKINNLMDDGKNLKVKNTELENSKVCVACKRELEKDSLIVIAKTITDNKNEMVSIKEKINELKPSYNKLTETIDLIKSKLTYLSNKDYSFDTELQLSYDDTKNKVTALKNDISKKDELLAVFNNNDTSVINNYPTELNSEIDIFKSEINKLNKDIEKENIKINEINKDIEKENGLITLCNNEIIILKEEKVEIDNKKEKINTIPVIELNIEKANNRIKENNILIKSKNDLIDSINANCQINENIDSIQLNIDGINETLTKKNDEKSKIISNIAMLDDRINSIDTEIDKFREQKKKEEILNIYGKCVHRDGLPTFLLKKSIGVINQELNNLLTLVDFTVFFDDDLNLKMSTDDRLDVSISAIQASGMERSFIACALKIALRKVNNKSKPNLLIFDEITGKLDAESVVLFGELLEVIKKEVDKLIIIEHQNNINYDVLINVTKNKEGISDLEIIY